ncbi:MAG: S8 family peptidase [Terriglobia bacterium]|jgi:serine protease AprX
MKNLLRIAVLILTASCAFARHPKIAPDLGGVDRTSKVDVIIQFKHVPTEAQHQKVRNQGGMLRAPFELLKGALYSVPASALERLANDPEVAYISPDRKVGGMLDLTADAVNAAAGWVANLDGSGIGIAVIDSGISNHQDLKSGGSSRVVYSLDLVGGGTDDHYGHGEHVAGIVAGNGQRSTCPTCTRTFKGMAPNANLINLRALDQNGQGKDSTVISAIAHAIALKRLFNIRVINLSLGRPVFESYTLDPLCLVAEAAWKAGIVVVVAAGNDGRDNSVGNNGYGTITAPGNDPYVITVGAMKTVGTPTRYDDRIASYSSKGPTVIDHIVKPDVVAPGNLVVSLLASRTDTLPATYPQTLIPKSYYEASGNSTSNDYFMLNGTSMATPVVSGAVALLLQAQPGLKPDQVKARLMRTAYKTFPPTSQATDPVTGQVYVSQYDVFTVGAGYLDIQAALADTNVATGNAVSPTATYDSGTGNVNLVFASGSVWGTGTVWSTGTVWGQGVVNGTGAIWGTSAIWGQSDTQAFRTIWGTGTIWGQTSAQATSIQVDGEN